MESRLFKLGLGGVIKDGAPPPFLDRAELSSLEEPLRRADTLIRERAAAGVTGYGWVGLPYRDIESVREAAGKISGFDSIVQIGIGGSALGNLMLNNAFLHPYHNELTREERNAPRFYMADNPDPACLASIWDCIDPERTAFIVARKSGSTAETIALFLWFFNALSERVGREEALHRFAFITDHEKGILRSLASAGALAALDVPPDVGGRFSLFSPVGLLSALALGMPVGDMLQGARLMDGQLKNARGLWENPAWMLAALHTSHFGKGRPMAVTMPYCDGLERFAEWHAQLWGESLGKSGKGSTPVRALGAIDQHSQVQLYVGGPDDKLYTLIDVERKSPETKIPPEAFEALAPVAYLGGHGFSELLSVEARSTAAALLKAERPVIWLELPQLDGVRLGAMVFLYEMVTALTGFLLDVDPFDQPGVEQGKRYTYGLMGREGYAGDAEEARRGFGKILENILSVQGGSD